jgi:molecular chaperone GrpE (heat shock protein)
MRSDSQFNFIKIIRENISIFKSSFTSRDILLYLFGAILYLSGVVCPVEGYFFFQGLNPKIQELFLLNVGIVTILCSIVIMNKLNPRLSFYFILNFIMSLIAVSLYKSIYVLLIKDQISVYLTLYAATQILFMIIFFVIFKEESGDRIFIHVPSFASIRQRLEDIIVDVPIKSEKFMQFQVDLERWGMEMWNSENRAKNEYKNLLSDYLDLFDVIENYQYSKDNNIKIIYEKGLRILNDRGIEEIYVNIGEDFNDKEHKHVDFKYSQIEDGKVLEVLLKGYRITEKNGIETRVIRPVNVIISKNKDNSDRGVKQ